MKYFWMLDPSKVEYTQESSNILTLDLNNPIYYSKEEAEADLFQQWGSTIVPEFLILSTISEPHDLAQQVINDMLQNVIRGLDK